MEILACVIGIAFAVFNCYFASRLDVCIRYLAAMLTCGDSSFDDTPRLLTMTLNPFKYRISVMKRYIKEVKKCHNSPQR